MWITFKTKGFPGGSEVKASACKVGDLGSIPGFGKSPGGGQPTPVFLPGESPWTEEPGGLQSLGLQKVGTTEQLTTLLALEAC